MRFILLTLITLGIGGAIYYFYSEQQLDLFDRVSNSQNAAQEATDAYRQKQQDMMNQLGQ